MKETREELLEIMKRIDYIFETDPNMFWGRARQLSQEYTRCIARLDDLERVKK